MSCGADVLVTVTGGVAYLQHAPEGVRVVIRDYDVEGADEESLDTDEEGGKYVEAEDSHGTARVQIRSSRKDVT